MGGLDRCRRLRNRRRQSRSHSSQSNTLSPVPKLSVIGSAITPPLPAYDEQPDVSTTVLCFPTPILYSLALAKRLDTSTARHVRTTALPLGRVLNRVSRVWPKLPHGIPGSLRLVSYISIPCADLLRRLSKIINSPRQLCLHGVCVRPMPGMRRCTNQRTHSRSSTEVPAL